MRKPFLFQLLVAVVWGAAFGVSADEEVLPVKVLTYPGGFKEDGMWVALHAASDNQVYVGLCSHGGSGRLYVYQPDRGLRHITMIQEAVNEMTSRREPQGKLHSQIIEDSDGTLWFGSDVSNHYYLARWDGPRSYPGGHMLTLDPVTHEVTDLGIPFPKEAIRNLLMDRERRRLYVVTFPWGDSTSTTWTPV